MNEREGERIVGSRLFRHYCPGCGAAMRVVKQDVNNRLVWCEQCTLHPQTGGVGGPLDEDGGGFYDYARKQGDE